MFSTAESAFYSIPSINLNVNLIKSQLSLYILCIRSIITVSLDKAAPERTNRTMDVLLHKSFVHFSINIIIKLILNVVKIFQLEVK